jgi:hypothetical protein
MVGRKMLYLEKELQNKIGKLVDSHFLAVWSTVSSNAVTIRAALSQAHCEGSLYGLCCPLNECLS